MPICLLCNKTFEMITESHMKKYHGITCKDYAREFEIAKGKLNQQHSQKMEGDGNPRFAVILSPETKKKISQRHKESGRFKNSGNPMFGKTHTVTARKKISDRLKMKLKGEGNPFYGKKHTLESREKISRVRIEKGLAKGKNNPLFGRGHNEQTKTLISRIKKDLFMQHPEKHINRIIAKNYKSQKSKKGGYISKKQVEIYEVLKEKFPDAELNYPLKTEDGLYFADIGIPSLKLNLEYDSSYWHQNELKDLKRDNNILEFGWNVIRIKEEQIKSLNSKPALFEYIQRLITVFQKGGSK